MGAVRTACLALVTRNLVTTNNMDYADEELLPMLPATEKLVKLSLSK